MTGTTLASVKLFVAQKTTVRKDIALNEGIILSLALFGIYKYTKYPKNISNLKITMAGKSKALVPFSDVVLRKLTFDTNIVRSMECSNRWTRKIK
jgi:hypothetical protein